VCCSTPTSSSPHDADCVAIPFMVQGPYHERNCVIVNSSTYSFDLSLSKGSERIATQSRRVEKIKEGDWTT
jgi:hypothetical protein